MREALDLARGGAGRVAPNPLVGCVVVRDGEVVGAGCHERFGEAHAEVNALREAGERARGATLYVTLEPCAHMGKTPPCTQAILRAGIARVVFAVRDPNPAAAGGAEVLAGAGLEVSAGVLAREAALGNGAFLKRASTRLPLVHLKIATALDGRVTGPAGSGGRITGDEARAMVHRLRWESGCVLTGIGTVLADNPYLTVRLPELQGERQPVRVVLDTVGRTPARCHLVENAKPEAPVLLVTDAEHAARLLPLTRDAVEVAVVDAAPDGRLSLDGVLRLLGGRGLDCVFVEAGPRLATALLRGRHVDRVSVFVAPRFVGSQGLAMLGDLGLGYLEQFSDLRHRVWTAVGDDMLLSGWSVWCHWLYDVVERSRDLCSPGS
jgi:diaminohydroxyphosphoribosylaminopyrimidine deaminase/5-amino-6-(5-phosphoribosylamino)uracil reductase